MDWVSSEAKLSVVASGCLSLVGSKLSCRRTERDRGREMEVNRTVAVGFQIRDLTVMILLSFFFWFPQYY